MQNSQKPRHIDYYFLEGFFQEQLPERYSCPICLSPVQKKAFLTQCCGKHFCYYCISRMVGIESCPMCKSKTLAIFPNKERQREIKQIRVRCPVTLEDSICQSSTREEVESSFTFTKDKDGYSCTAEENKLLDGCPCGKEGDESGNLKRENAEEDKPHASTMCNWTGELGQVDAHLKEAHGHDKRWKACDNTVPQAERNIHKVCMYHLNQSLRLINGRLGYYRVMPQSGVSVSINREASDIIAPSSDPIRISISVACPGAVNGPQVFSNECCNVPHHIRYYNMPLHRGTRRSSGLENTSNQYSTSQRPQDDSIILPQRSIPPYRERDHGNSDVFSPSQEHPFRRELFPQENPQNETSETTQQQEDSPQHEVSEPSSQATPRHEDSEPYLQESVQNDSSEQSETPHHQQRPHHHASLSQQLYCQHGVLLQPRPQLWREVCGWTLMPKDHQEHRGHQQHPPND